LKNRLKREHLSDKVVDILGKKILRNELKSGEIIIETQISKAWGISRSPVRDALRTLEKQRLVEKVPRGSYKVFELTAEYITSFHDVVTIFYGYAIPRAVKKLTNDNRHNLQSIDNNIKKSIRENDFNAYVKNVCRFGQSVLKYAKNPILVQISTDVLPTAKRILYTAINQPACSLSLGNHPIRIACKAVMDGDSAGAVEAFNKFINDSRAILLASYHDKK